MRENIDLYLGLSATLLSLFTFLIFQLMPPESALTMKLYGLPMGWAACVGGMLIFRKRPLHKLWWVWLSFLPLLYYWGVYVFVMLVFGGGF